MEDAGRSCATQPHQSASGLSKRPQWRIRRELGKGVPGGRRRVEREVRDDRWCLLVAAAKLCRLQWIDRRADVKLIDWAFTFPPKVKGLASVYQGGCAERSGK